MRILVIGDAMVDEYWYGKTSRVSQEAPVPVVAVSRTETRSGGAGNVANNIEAMGVQVERIFSGSERIRKIRLISGAQHVARIDYDHPQDAIPPNAAFREALERCGLVVAVDYGKGSLGAIAALIRAANGTPVLVDPKGHDLERYRGAALIKPNREEMKELVGGWSTQDDLDFKARQFLLACGIGSILLTQGADGMTLYQRGETIHMPAEAVTAVDVSGAGEAALAAYAAGLAKGYAPKTCLKFASRAAAIAVSRPGTVVIKAEELWNS